MFWTSSNEHQSIFSQEREVLCRSSRWSRNYIEAILLSFKCIYEVHLRSQHVYVGAPSDIFRGPILHLAALKSHSRLFPKTARYFDILR